MATCPGRLACVAVWLALFCQPLAAQESNLPATAPASDKPAISELAPASSADPAPEVQAEYRAVVARAIAEYDAGHWAEARSLFLQAHALLPSARTLRTLGMTSFELRSYARALQELQAALDDPRRPLPDDQRQQVAQLIEQTRAFVGRYRVRLAPKNAELLIDGAPRVLGQDGVLLLEVGGHELVARASGHSEIRRRLDVQGREDEQLVLELTSVQQSPAARLATPAPSVPPAVGARVREKPQSPGGRLWTWAAAGTAVALSAASTVLWLVSDAKYDKKYQECTATKTCTRANTDTSAISATQTAHQVTLGLAIAAGAGAVTLFFIEGKTQESPRVAIGPGSLHVHGTF
jgi:tetratricopeptide (TPR) repeat protein